MKFLSPSGKSTSARAVAERLGFRHLESGAFYRALTYAALDAGIPVEQWPALTRAQLDALQVRAEPAPDGYRFFMGEREIGAALRNDAVTAHVSQMARVGAVRDWLLDRLRAAADAGDLVADGRDMGTVVFPDAELKIFLVATPETRARRRLRERGIEDPDAAELRAEIERIERRDRTDAERDVAPMRPADDAIELDTSELTFEEQVGRIVGMVGGRGIGEG